MSSTEPGSERQRAERRPADAALLDDACQHRERRHGHRGAEIHHALPTRHVRAEETAVRVQARRQHGAEQERRNDARPAKSAWRCGTPV